MHRFHSTFRQFSLRGLFAAGAIASLGLPMGQHADGIGGSAIQPTYSPRESVGAAPSVSLISSGSSSSSSVAAASTSGGGGGESASQGSSSGGSRTRHVSSDDEGGGTVKKTRRHKKAEREEGETRVAKSSGGATYESKDSKESKVVPLVAAAAKPLITLSTGFESRYIYHGVDIVGFNSSGVQNGITITNRSTGATATLSPSLVSRIDRAEGVPVANRTSPILYVNGNIEYKGFHLGVGFIHAIDETVPSREGIENTATAVNRLFNLAGFPTPIGKFNNTKKYYKEVDINTDYTLGIIANVLDVTVGFNSYIIPDHDFKGTNYQGEAFGRITYKQIPYIQPSITYFRYISDARAVKIGTQNVTAYLNGTSNTFSFTESRLGEYLNGNYVEVRLDGSYPLITTPDFAVAFSAYGLISVNDGYLTKQVSNSTSTEFNTAEVGAKIPMTIANHFTITPYINYGFDISDSHQANDFRGKIGPFKEDVWAGVTMSYRF